MEKMYDVIKNSEEITKEGQSVVIRREDWSSYQDGKSNNGGCYLYWEDYEYWAEDGLWYLSYGCSCDIGHTCPCCGELLNDSDSHWDEKKNKYFCGEFQSVTTEELLDMINDDISNDDISFKCIVGGYMI